jgi:hypothetical protein
MFASPAWAKRLQWQTAFTEVASRTFAACTCWCWYPLPTLTSIEVLYTSSLDTSSRVFSSSLTVSFNCILVHGEWSDWGNWSSCSVSCGEGRQLRFRSCTNPKPQHGGRDCRGPREDQRACIDKARCPSMYKLIKFPIGSQPNMRIHHLVWPYGVDQRHQVNTKSNKRLKQTNHQLHS